MTESALEQLPAAAWHSLPKELQDLAERPEELGEMTYWVVSKDVFMCTPKLGEDFHFDDCFSKGLKPPTSIEGEIRWGS